MIRIELKYNNIKLMNKHKISIIKYFIFGLGIFFNFKIMLVMNPIKLPRNSSEPNIRRHKVNGIKFKSPKHTVKIDNKEYIKRKVSFFFNIILPPHLF